MTLAHYDNRFFFEKVLAYGRAHGILDCCAAHHALVLQAAHE